MGFGKAKSPIVNSIVRRENRSAWLLLLIPLLWWIVFFLVPFFMALSYSFTDLKLDPSQISRIGFFQYEKVLTDENFWLSIRNTVIWTFFMMIGNNFFGLLLAVLISRLKRGRKLFIALLFWPTLVSAVVGSTITAAIFSADQFGLANIIVGWFGVGPVAWFENPDTALWALMVMPFFFGFSIKMIIYYSGLMSIPQSYYEACDLETNSKWHKFRHISLPLLKNAFVLNMILSLIEGLKVLGPMQLVTNGGPDNSTLSSLLYIFKLSFETPNRGQGVAAAFILFMIILVFSLVQLKLSGREADTYE
jgi:multiple sugar transport system permease protein